MSSRNFRHFREIFASKYSFHILPILAAGKVGVLGPILALFILKVYERLVLEWVIYHVKANCWYWHTIDKIARQTRVNIFNA